MFMHLWEIQSRVNVEDAREIWKYLLDRNTIYELPEDVTFTR